MPGVAGFLKKNRTSILLIIYLVFSLVSLSFSSRTVEFRPKEWGMAVISPFQIGFSAVTTFIRRTFNSINELRRLSVEYEELKQKLSEYKSIERDKVELERENQRLKEQLGFSQSLAYRHITAEIIGKEPSNLFNTIIINKGSRHGIHAEMPVIAYQNGFQGLVGKVIEVGEITSMILPIYDSRSYVSARLQSSRFEGLVNGSGSESGFVVMRHVHKRAREETRYGDLVITSGMKSIYPKDIFIGRIRSIGAQEWESGLELEIEPVIDFTRLEYVFVLDLEN
jgi:rod shape-determining protein MreC